MRLRLLHGSNAREPQSVTTALELPASALELAGPGPARVGPAQEQTLEQALAAIDQELAGGPAAAAAPAPTARPELPQRELPAHELPAVTPRAAPAAPVRAADGAAAYPRTTRPDRTARAQYRESDDYQSLGKILVGLPARIFLVVAILIAYNGALGWIALQVWRSSATSNDRLLVLAVIGIGAVVGWAAADMERAYRSRSRFYS